MPDGSKHQRQCDIEEHYRKLGIKVDGGKISNYCKNNTEIISIYKYSQNAFLKLLMPKYKENTTYLQLGFSYILKE